MMVDSNTTNTERVESLGEILIGTLTSPMEVISTTCKIMDEDDWEPVPASVFMDKTFDAFGGQELPVHFLEAHDPLFMLGDDTESWILEPTPIRENIDAMSQLLEPISAESFDKIFET